MLTCWLLLSRCTCLPLPAPDGLEAQREAAWNAASDVLEVTAVAAEIVAWERLAAGSDADSVAETIAFRVYVHRRFKGAGGDTLTVMAPGQTTSCRAELRLGQRVVLYLRGRQFAQCTRRATGDEIPAEQAWLERRSRRRGA